MSQTTFEAHAHRLPVWILGVASAALVWNLFGFYQLSDSMTQSESGLMMRGMSAEAARIYHGLPEWMHAAFALGAGGGVLGSTLLAMRRRAATPVFATSLGAYVALFGGDWLYGLFAALPGQISIAALVLAIAAAMLVLSGWAQRRGLLA